MSTKILNIKYFNMKCIIIFHLKVATFLRYTCALLPQCGDSDNEKLPFRLSLPAF